MISALFICTGNQYRSPIAAEALRRQLVRDHRSGQWRVSSAGTWTSPGRRSPRAAIELARSVGVNIERHVTRMVDEKMLEDADLVFVMEQGHRESIQTEFPFARKKLYLLSQVVHEFAHDIPDPAGANGNAGIIIRDLVEMIRLGHGKIYRIAESI